MYKEDFLVEAETILRVMLSRVFQKVVSTSQYGIIWQAKVCDLHLPLQMV